MKKILIFKSDRIGDLINISSVIKNIKLNYKNSEISIICSEYNSHIARFYPEISNILILKSSILQFIFNYYNFFIKNKFDHIFQFDGKKKSYILGCIIRSNHKSCISYVKEKIFFNVRYILKRPNFFYSIFYNHLIRCEENLISATNKKYHYLSLYLEALKKNHLKIYTNEHHLPFKGKPIPDFNGYIHLHIDERWIHFDFNFYKKILNFIENNLVDNKFYITSNLNSNTFFDNLENHFNDKKNKNIRFNSRANITELINIIHNCKISISNHTGFTIHVAASFKKKIIDIVSPKKDLHYDRWVPLNIDYSRYDFDNFFSSFNFKNF